MGLCVSFTGNILKNALHVLSGVKAAFNPVTQKYWSISKQWFPKTFSCVWKYLCYCVSGSGCPKQILIKKTWYAQPSLETGHTLIAETRHTYPQMQCWWTLWKQRFHCREGSTRVLTTQKSLDQDVARTTSVSCDIHTTSRSTTCIN